MEEYSEIFRAWKAGNEEEKFVTGWLFSGWVSPFKQTIEELTAYTAYRSVGESIRNKYAEISPHLSYLFFSLSPEQLSFVERTLPPYPYVFQMVLEGKNFSEGEIEILRKKIPRNPLKALGIIREKEKILKKHDLIPEEYQLILERQKESDWRDTQRLLALFYATTSLQIYLSTHNPLAPIAYLMTFPIPYQTFKYLSRKIPNKKLRSYLDKISLAYLLATSPTGMIISSLQFGLAAPLISRLIEKYWHSDFFPDLIREAIYETQVRFSGLKPTKFDEKKIRGELYEIKINSPNLPASAIEKFRDEVESGLVEIEDPRKVLFSPFALSWFRRRVVAIKEGSEVKVVDKEYIKKLSQKEGIPEREIERNPGKYLGIDLLRSKGVAYTRDIIGILPCEVEEALVYKEGYTAILGKKADEIMRRSSSYLYNSSF